MKKIIFKGLGPTGNVVHDGKMIEDGAIIEMESHMADAYIRTELAYEVVDEAAARNVQEQAIRNKERRKEVIEAETSKKGGKK